MDNQKGYLNLIGAVIKQAVRDLKLIKSKKPHLAKIGCDAYEFLSGKELDKWCGMAGLNASYIRRRIKIENYAKLVLKIITKIENEEKAG